jgi:nucleoporin GLE1
MGRSSYPSQLDSPSKQLIADLTNQLEQLRVHNLELKRVKAYERRSFYENLDKIESDLEAQHNDALDKVAALHEKVLEEAQETLRAHQRAVEEERRQKEEQARKEQERRELARIEALKREQEELKREIERQTQIKAAEEARREAERKKQLEQEEKKRKEQERLTEEARKRQEEAKKAEEQEAARLKAETEQKQQAVRQKQLGAGRLSEQELKVHQRYVELHQHLKKFRQYLRDQSKSNPIVKQHMGEMRRSIKKCVGQLREGKGVNKVQVSSVSSCILVHVRLTMHSIDPRNPNNA